jgi:hypothetical protein
VDEFVKLLGKCIAQARLDPEGVTENPHLYGYLQKNYLRLCHGNVDEFGVTK